MNSQRVTIKNPCHMKWYELNKIKNSKNRYCYKCSLEIKDFNTITNDEIVKYLSNRKTEKICAKLYSVNELSRLSKVQEKVLNWRESIKSHAKNDYFKSFALTLVGLMVIATGCVKVVGEPVSPCKQKLVPDTTTIDPNDSIQVEVCE